MVPEIATGLAPLAMTEGDGGWSRFAVGAVIITDCTAERHGGRSLQRKKSPDSGESGDFPLKSLIQYAERKPATSREGPMV